MVLDNCAFLITSFFFLDTDPSCDILKLQHLKWKLTCRAGTTVLFLKQVFFFF
jgi:hypothetical protein